MPTTPKAQLTDISVDEVSVVDRAANQRRFIVAKRDDSKPEGVNKNADGGTDENAATAAAGAAGEQSTVNKGADAEGAAGAAGQAGAGADAAAAGGAAGGEQVDVAAAEGGEAKTEKDEAGAEGAAAGDAGGQADGAAAEPEKAGDVEKASPMHEQLAREAADAIIAQAEKVIAAAANMSPSDAYASLDAMWDLMWAFRQSATVATLAKADAGSPAASAVDATLAKIKTAKADAEKAKADGMGMGGGDAMAALAQVGARIAAALERIAENGAMKAQKDEAGDAATPEPAQATGGDPAAAEQAAAAVSAAVDAVKAEIAKQLGAVTTRLNRIEKAHSDPNAVGPAGAPTNDNSGGDDWPLDLAAG